MGRYCRHGAGVVYVLHDDQIPTNRAQIFRYTPNETISQANRVPVDGGQHSLSLTDGGKKKVREIVVERKPAPELAVIYIIKTDEDILYIGKSFRIEDRILDHFTNHNVALGGSNFSDYAKKNITESLDWEIEFVECPENMKYPERWAREKEYELIGLHKPVFNVNGK